MQLIETAPHEFAAHFLFEERGLEPFFACDRRVKDGGGSQNATFERDDETWEATLSYRDSGLKHPGRQLPSGTEFWLDEMREFELTVASDDDPAGERSVYIHIAPRWQGMVSESGQEIPVPDDVEEAVNLHVQGSNIEFDQYQPLIQDAMRAVGINGRYFETLHEFSTILDAERYVRVHEDASGPVHARDGPIAQLGHLLEHDRVGRLARPRDAAADPVAPRRSVHVDRLPLASGARRHEARLDRGGRPCELSVAPLPR